MLAPRTLARLGLVIRRVTPRTLQADKISSVWTIVRTRVRHVSWTTARTPPACKQQRTFDPLRLQNLIIRSSNIAEFCSCRLRKDSNLKRDTFCYRPVFNWLKERMCMFVFLPSCAQYYLPVGSDCISQNSIIIFTAVVGGVIIIALVAVLVVITLRQKPSDKSDVES